MADTAPTLTLLDEARALAAAREWGALARRLEGAGEADLFAEPEVGFLYTDSLWRTGRPAGGVPVAERVLAAAGQRADRRLILRVLNVLGISLFHAGQMAPAEEVFAELLERASEWGEEIFVARASNNLGSIENIRGSRHLALSSYQRAMAAYRRLGDQRGLAQTYHNLGITYRDLGFDKEADAHFRRAIELAEATNTEDVVGLAETERALLRARTGDGKLGGEMARRAAERFRRISDPVGAANAVRVLAAAERAQGLADDAMRHLDEALEAARAHSDALLVAEVQRDRGEMLRDSGDAGGAREAFADAAEHFARIGAAAEAEAVRAMADALSSPG
jgi:tetratricopeptide (TPR) repeat protein